MDIEEFKQKIELIKLKHNLNCELEDLKLKYDESNAMLGAITEFAKMTLKSVIVINGAAIISLLTFLGNVINNGWVHYNKTLLMIGMSSFIVGLIFACFATFLGYLCQTIYRNTNTEEKPEVSNRCGDIAKFLAIISLGSSLVLFGAGAMFSLNGILN